jgi:hypothetical protein
MENTIGWLLVCALIAAPVGIFVYLVQRWRLRRQVEKDRTDQLKAELQALKDRERERWRQDALKPSITDITRYPKTVGVAGGGGGRSYTSATALPATTSTASNDNALNDLAMLYVLNTALTHGSASAQVDYDAGSIKVDAPARSDDEDSRVVRDTFSSSSSDSFWSSSDSSSSSDVSSDW